MGAGHMSQSFRRNSDARQVRHTGIFWPGVFLLGGLVACTTAGDGGDSTSGALDVLPTTDFVADGQQGGPFDDSSVYVVTNTGDGDLFWSVSPSAGWLSISVASGTLGPEDSEQLTVSVNDAFADGLASGNYPATITFTDLARGETAAVVSAALDVQAPGSGGDLEASPAEFTTGGPKGGPFAPASQALQLTNPGSGSVSWLAASNASWLSISQGSGTVAASGQQQVSASILSAANALGTGMHTGKITFRDSTSGLTLVEVEASIGIGTTIENQAWLNVHGRPFLPIGVWNQPPWQSQVTYLKGLGINTYLNNGLTPAEPTNGQLLDLLAANDMWAILQFDSAVKNHPRLLGWLMGDEPDLNNIPVAVVQQGFDAIKAADPDHFVGINTMGNFYWDSNFGNPSVESLYQGYTAIPDIASFDMYPVTGWNQPTWVYMPGAMTKFLLDRYVDHAKPVWAIVEASDQRLSWTPLGTPGPTPAQMRFEVWDAIIRGATAIHYFTIAFNPFVWTNLTPTIEQELTRTNGQVTALSDVILSVPPALSVTSSELNGQSHNRMLRKKGAFYYLFVDNADMGYRAATITFNFPQAISSVSVYGEGRTLTPSGNSFSDVFAPLEVHIYKVRL